MKDFPKKSSLYILALVFGIVFVGEFYLIFYDFIPKLIGFVDQYSEPKVAEYVEFFIYKLLTWIAVWPAMFFVLLGILIHCKKEGKKTE